MGNYNDISAKVQKIDNMNVVTDVTEATLMTVKEDVYKRQVWNGTKKRTSMYIAAAANWQKRL